MRTYFINSRQTAKTLIQTVFLACSFVTILTAPNVSAQTSSNNPVIQAPGSEMGKSGLNTKEDFSTTILVSESPTVVFNAINNPRGWWQGKFEGSTDKLGEEFIYRMEEMHYSKQRIIDLVPDKKVVWLVTESKLNFTKDKSEWTGTKIIFEITKINNQTQLRFTHVGLVPKFECYGNCSNAWEQLIQESLFSLITTGKGKNVF